jgi:hypothetical protein
MKRSKTCFPFSLMAMALIWSLAGCAAKAPAVKQMDRLDQRRWEMETVPEPSGEDTNWGIWATMQGAG